MEMLICGVLGDVAQIYTLLATFRTVSYPSNEFRGWRKSLMREPIRRGNRELISGDVRKARDWFTQALEAQSEASGQNHCSSVYLLTRLAAVCNRSGALVQSEAFYHQAIFALAGEYGFMNTFMHTLLARLAQVRQSLGEIEHAVALSHLASGIRLSDLIYENGYLALVALSLERTEGEDFDTLTDMLN